jgi:hypothetical protein
MQRLAGSQCDYGHLQFIGEELQNVQRRSLFSGCTRQEMMNLIYCEDPWFCLFQLT